MHHHYVSHLQPKSRASPTCFGNYGGDSIQVRDAQYALCNLEVQITHLPLVLPILVELSNRADQIRFRYDLSSLQSILLGGAPLSKKVIEGFVVRYLGMKIL